MVSERGRHCYRFFIAQESFLRAYLEPQLNLDSIRLSRISRAEPQPPLFALCGVFKQKPFSTIETQMTDETIIGW